MPNISILSGVLIGKILELNYMKSYTGSIENYPNKISCWVLPNLHAFIAEYFAVKNGEFKGVMKTPYRIL